MPDRGKEAPRFVRRLVEWMSTPDVATHTFVRIEKHVGIAIVTLPMDGAICYAWVESASDGEMMARARTCQNVKEIPVTRYEKDRRRRQRLS